MRVSSRTAFNNFSWPGAGAPSQAGETQGLFAVHGMEMGYPYWESPQALFSTDAAQVVFYLRQRFLKPQENEWSGWGVS